ncbi:hypothetical protein [Mobiluncus curtisii]|uniref:phage terminase small subunit n=1 Tax=Mobiluncus curtisii TaxID=2051 RepID=UPI0024311447|nr:hypothetical protein [Mobiluncus curtisii]
MGSRGPVGKRSEDRIRRNKPDGGLTIVDMPASVCAPPEPDDEWCVAARRIWDSLVSSGQSRFYEPSDWAYAQFAMDEMSRYVKNGKQVGDRLSAIDSMLVRLLLTEGDRRRAGLELSRAVDDASEREAAKAWAKKLA